MSPRNQGGQDVFLNMSYTNSKKNSEVITVDIMHSNASFRMPRDIPFQYMNRGTIFNETYMETSPDSLKFSPAPRSVPPSVCVIIAACNAAGTIGRAINSALAEPEVSEIVVVDDASDDNTAEIARSYGDGTGRLKVLEQEKNSGPASARNRAIAESSASWISILDADDFFLSGRIRKLLSYAGSADFIADDLWQVPEHDVSGPRRSFLEEPLAKPRWIGFHEFVLSNVTSRNRRRRELGFLKPLMRRQFLVSHRLRYQEHMRLGEDFELYARALALEAKFILLPAKGYVSVVRRNSLSENHSEADLIRLRNCSCQLREDIPLAESDRDALRQHYLSVDCRLQWRLLINAVRARNTKVAIKTFLRPYPVPLYLLERLASQFYTRVIKRYRWKARENMSVDTLLHISASR